MATGGSTSGSDTTVSSSDLPGKARRDSSQPRATATGSASSVATTAVAAENSAMPRMLWFMRGAPGPQRAARPKPAFVNTTPASGERR